MEKNRVKLDDDSDEEEEEGKEGQENAHSASNHTPAVPAPCAAAEEKKPQLTQEELEAKQGIPGDTEHGMNWHVNKCGRLGILSLHHVMLTGTRILSPQFPACC